MAKESKRLDFRKGSKLWLAVDGLEKTISTIENMEVDREPIWESLRDYMGVNNFCMLDSSDEPKCLRWCAREKKRRLSEWEYKNIVKSRKSTRFTEVALTNRALGRIQAGITLKKNRLRDKETHRLALLARQKEQE